MEKGGCFEKLPILYGTAGKLYDTLGSLQKK